MEDSCLECVCKHLGCAMIQLGEWKRGYPGKLSQALSDLECAVREAEKDHPDMAFQIYGVKRAVIDGLPDQPGLEGLWDLIKHAESVWLSQLESMRGESDESEV